MKSLIQAAALVSPALARRDLTRGSPVDMSGKRFNVVSHGLDENAASCGRAAWRPIACTVLCVAGLLLLNGCADLTAPDAQAAYEAAMQKNGGKWPTRAEIADAMKGSRVATLTGTTQTRADNDGVVDQIVGVTQKSEGRPFPVIGEMVRYKGDSLMPQPGTDPIAWISTLKPEFAKSLPKPGSYK